MPKINDSQEFDPSTAEVEEFFQHVACAIDNLRKARNWPNVSILIAMVTNENRVEFLDNYSRDSEVNLGIVSSLLNDDAIISAGKRFLTDDIQS